MLVNNVDDSPDDGDLDNVDLDDDDLVEESTYLPLLTTYLFH